MHVTLRSRSTGGIGLTLSRGRSYVHDTLRKTHRRRLRASRLWTLRAPAGSCPQGRLLATKASLLQEAGIGQGTLQGSQSPKQRVIFSILQTCNACFKKQPQNRDGDLCSNSEDQTRHITDCSLLPGTARGMATEPQGSGCSPLPSPAHKANSSTNEIKPLTHSKAAEELTPAFSLLTVYFSVKYITYSFIGLIIIYYRLEILSTFPYFNHMNPILHTD